MFFFFFQRKKIYNQEVFFATKKESAEHKFPYFLCLSVDDLNFTTREIKILNVDIFKGCVFILSKTKDIIATAQLNIFTLLKYLFVNQGQKDRLSAALPFATVVS